MMNLGGNKYKSKWLIVILLYLLPSGMSKLAAQEPPPRPVRITPTAQILSFGAFYNGAGGGSVTVDPSGARSSTGDVVLLGLGYSYSSAMFEVHAQRGTVISILKGPDVLLSGIPAGSMSLHIGDTNPNSPFVSNVIYNIAIPLYVGGTLTVGPPAANPPGSYSGSFYITIVKE